MNDEAPEWFSARDVKRFLTYEDLIPNIERALASFSKGKSGGVVQPLRITMGINEQRGYMLVMPVLSTRLNAMVTKMVTRYPAVSPPSYSILVYFNLVTGKPLAFMDGDIVTRMRTASASAVATKYLAPANSRILAILGAGAQGASHVEALQVVNTFEQIRIWSRTFEKAQKLAKQFNCTACRTAEEAVKDADVIATVTASKTPVLKADWVKQGAHINCVGACYRGWQELDPLLMKKADVYTDTKESALKTSADIILSGAEVLGEVGELVLGTKKANKNATTVFKSMGIAIEDLVSAKIVYDKKHRMANV